MIDGANAFLGANPHIQRFLTVMRTLPAVLFQILCSFVENPDNDSYGGGDAEDSGGPAGEPRHTAGQRRAVPPHSVLHQ